MAYFKDLNQVNVWMLSYMVLVHLLLAFSHRVASCANKYRQFKMLQSNLESSVRGKVLGASTEPSKTMLAIGRMIARKKPANLLETVSS